MSRGGEGGREGGRKEREREGAGHEDRGKAVVEKRGEKEEIRKWKGGDEKLT